MDTGSTKQIGAIKRTVEILEALQSLEGAGVTEIATHLGIPTSTAHSHLNTLESLECIQREGETYRMGLKFLEFGGFARENMKVCQTARPEIKALAEETGEWANLLVEENGRGVYALIERGEQAVEHDVYEGMRTDLHSTALGKSILAHKPRNVVENIIDQHGLEPVTPHTVTERETLFSQLEEIRNQGYATDNEERLQNMRCVAAPIVYPENQVFGAVSVSGPSGRMNGKRFQEDIPELVTNAADVVGINRTFS